MNRIVHRTQIDVDARGVFSSVILTFPNPNDQFIEGTYTLVITSSIQGSVYSKAIVFQASSNEIRVQQGDALQQQQQQITRRLDMQLSAPSIIGIDERFSIVARVTMDNTLFNVNASDIKARIIMPDSSARELRFNAIDDGIYATELTLSMVGLHVVTASIEHDGLKASSMASINVTDAPVLNMSNTLSRLSKSIDDLNSSIQGLRNDINASNARLSNSLEQIGSSTNQMLALLLPIIGMITIIVALQATILARRGTTAR
jgi:flagellar capping protein FliD